MKYLLTLLVLIICHDIQGVLEWTVIGKVTNYGQNVTLFCNVSNCCPDNSGWDKWTPVQRTLFIDVKTGRSNRKYDGYVLKNGYTLVIQNLTKEDLNVSYSCLYGFKLGERKFLLEDDVFTYIITTEPNNSTRNSSFSESTHGGIIVGVMLPVVAFVVIAFIFLKKRNTNNDYLIPSEIKGMSESDQKKYLQILKDGKESRYVVKIFILGKNGVGKTSLMRRLLKEPISDVKSTEGIDIVKRCKIRVRDGKWKECKVKENRLTDRFGRFVQSEATNQIRALADSKVSISNQNRSSVDILFPLEQSVSNNTFKDVEKSDSKNRKVIDDAEDPHVITTEMSCLINSDGNQVSRRGGQKIINNPTDAEVVHKETIFLESNRTNDSENKHLEKIKSTSISKKDDTADANDLFRVFKKGLKTKISGDEYADCVILDFAGHKEYYTTHQTFMTKNAVYLITANLEKSKVSNNEDDEDNLSFWFDNIHCYGADTKTSTSETQLDPPIIVVCTGHEISETINEEALNEKTTKFKDDFDSILNVDVRRQHLREGIHFLSNINNDETDFDKLRKSIYNAASNLPSWKEDRPVRWIQLEKALDNARSKSNTNNVLSLNDITELAKGLSVPISDQSEVILFLKYQHELGNVIYFDDTQDYVIIRPSWLDQAFKCIVCANDFRANLLTCPDWKTLKATGKASNEFVGKLLDFDQDICNHRDHVLKVMMKFDIIVRYDRDIDSVYIIPSMIQKSSTELWEQICDKVGANKDGCTRTSWICLDFDFLPPAIFNNILVRFMSDNKYDIYQLHHKIAIFDFVKSNGCRKLVICNTYNTICLQVWSWIDDQFSYTDIYKSFSADISKLKSKYGVMVIFKVKFMCGEANFTFEDNKLDVLEMNKTGDGIYCRHHRNRHTLSYAISLATTWIDEQSVMSEKSAGVITGGLEKEDIMVPTEIKLMADKRSSDVYLKLLESGYELKRDIRLVVVGKQGAGKTSLIRRLFGENISDVISTNGIDIHKIKCKAMSDDGIWNTLDVTSQQRNQSLEQAKMDIERMLKSNVDLKDKEEYATLLLWDFAGDEEFYHTHQTFLSSDAIYLVVTKLNEADDKHAQDLFQLWMDSIHCYSRMEEDKSNSADSKSSDDLDPPVVIVGTWRDAVTSESEEIDDAYRENMFKFTENMSEDELRHIRQEYFISNTEDDPSVFQKIREDILNLARKMKTWNQKYPLKFLQLEKRLQEKKKKFPIISFDEIQDISTDTPKPLNDNELRYFLEFHHEIRALVYFKDLPSYIILDTQWLSDAFKCIVTAKKFGAISIKNMTKWDELYSRGKLHNEVLDDIFRKSETTFSNHKNHILNVMEKFDIIIRPNISGTERDVGDGKALYYIPCMIKSEPECDIYEMFNVTENTCTKSTWLCYMFRFLPPPLMNHLIASLCRKYKVAEVVTEAQKKQIALFRSSAVFELEKTTKFAKLHIMKCPYWIQIQVWNFRKRREGGLYKYIDDFVTGEIVKIINTRFKMFNVTFWKKWECGLTKPGYVTGSNDFSEEQIPEYYCEKCTSTHILIDEWQDLNSRRPCLPISCEIKPGLNQNRGSISHATTTSSKVLFRINAGNRDISNIHDESTAAASLTGFTKEEINFSKMGMIALNILADVLYDLLKPDKPYLRSRCDCDITYLYSEHRNLNKHIPSNSWGGQWQRIQTTDVAIGDDIERIRLTRNELQHSRKFHLDDKRFNEILNILSDLLKRLDQHNKPTRLYTDHLNEILAKTISAEEVKSIKNEILGMAIEVEIEHLINVSTQ